MNSVMLLVWFLIVLVHIKLHLLQAEYNCNSQLVQIIVGPGSTVNSPVPCYSFSFKSHDSSWIKSFYSPKQSGFI